MLEIGAAADAPREARYEPNSTGYIPEASRRGGVRGQWLFWFTANLQVFAVALGFVPVALGLGELPAVLAAVSGSLFGSLFLAAHAAQGPILGVPQLVASQRQFGARGNIALQLVPLAMVIAGGSLSTAMVARGLSSLYGWPIWTGAGAVVLAGLGAAAIGHHGLHYAARAMLVVGVGVYAALSIRLVSLPAGAPHHGWPASAFVATFAVAAGYNLAFAPHAADYTRYLPSATSPARLFVAVLISSSASVALLMSLGVVLAERTGVQDVLGSLATAGDHVASHGGVLVLIFVVASAAVGQSIGSYSGGLILASMTEQIAGHRRGTRLVCTILLSLVTLVGALTVPAAYVASIGNVLRLALDAVIPWSAISLTDHYLLRPPRRSPVAPHLRYRETQPAGSSAAWAYAVGLLAMLPMLHVGAWTAPGAALLGGVDISFAVGFVSAALVYLAVTRPQRPGSPDSGDEAMHRPLDTRL